MTNAKFKLGISTASLFLRYHTEDALALLPSMGAEAVEVFMATFSEYRPPFDQIFAEKARISGANVHSIHTLNQHFEPQLFNPCDRTRDDAFVILHETLATGRAMGAHYYTFHGTPRLKRSAYHIDWETNGPKMAAIGDICCTYGITLCYENVHWTLYNYPGFFAKLRQYAPKMGATLDIKQARQANIDYRLFLEDMGNNLATVHVSDFDEDGKLCLPGRGTFDFAELFRRLADIGFEGAVLIEVYQGDFGEEKELVDSLAYLKSIRNTI